MARFTRSSSAKRGVSSAVLALGGASRAVLLAQTRENLRERLSLDEFHRVVRCARVDSEAVDRHDGRVIQPAGHARFALNRATARRSARRPWGSTLSATRRSMLCCQAS